MSMLAMIPSIDWTHQDSSAVLKPSTKFPSVRILESVIRLELPPWWATIWMCLCTLLKAGDLEDLG